MVVCSMIDCETGTNLSCGLCGKHYMRLRRNGDASIVKPRRTVANPKRSHRMYGAWAAMNNRCSNPNNSSYQRYGAKGIFVCDAWRADFFAFLADMGERPVGMTLDRINPYGPYSPENCRWADASTQRRNITAEGDARTRAALSAGVKASWARRRAASAALCEVQPRVFAEGSGRFDVVKIISPRCK